MRAVRNCKLSIRTNRLINNKRIITGDNNILTLLMPIYASIIFKGMIDTDSLMTKELR